MHSKSVEIISTKSLTYYIINTVVVLSNLYIYIFNEETYYFERVADVFFPALYMRNVYTI